MCNLVEAEHQWPSSIVSLSGQSLSWVAGSQTTELHLTMSCFCCTVEEEREEEPADRIRDAFNTMDINGDGCVTFNEFKKVGEMSYWLRLT